MHYFKDSETTENERSIVCEKQDKYYRKNKFDFHPRFNPLIYLYIKELSALGDFTVFLLFVFLLIDLIF